MRIVCQKCSAAYAIDDKFVTAKGVRAQCPRCRTLQLVKKEDAGAAATPASPFALETAKTAAPAAAPAGGGFDFAQLGAAPAPKGPAAPAPPAPFAFDFSAPPPPAAGFGAPPPAPAGFPPPPATGFPPPAATGFPPPAAPMPFDFGAPPPPAPSKGAAPGPFGAPPPAVGFSSSPSGSTPFDFGAPPPAPSSPSFSGFSPPAPSAPTFEAPGSDIRCKSCSKALTDPFDQALGTCDDCRSKQTERIETQSPDTDAGRVERVEASSIGQRMSGTRPALQVPTSTNSNPNSNAIAAAEASVVRTAQRAGSGGEGRGKVIALVALVVVVLGGAGALLFVKKPWEKKRPPLVVKNPGAAAKKPVDAVVQTWRMNYPELDGAPSKQAEGYVENGEQLLSKDTTSAYLEAEEEFQKALVVDASNDRAVAGWLLALAFGRGLQIDDQTAKAAEGMVSGAEQRSGNPRLYVAHAHFLIARNGNANDIQVLAERGKNSSNTGDKALAAMALGQSMLGKNEALAGQAFAEALRLDPKLKRGYFFQARLAAAAGRYKEATDNLEKRLQLDNDQWEAAEELARIYVEVGEWQKGKKVLEAAVKAAPRNVRARIGLAMLSYQHAGEARAAIETLTGVVQNKDLAKKDLSDAYAHMSAANRVLGDVAKAADAAEQAVELAPESVTAKLQHFFAMIEKNVTSEARIDLDAIKGKLGDPNVDNLLEGRLLMSLGRFDEASTVLSKVHETDGRRADALLLAGAAAARAKRDGLAWELCLKRGVRLDPFTTPNPAMSSLYFRPADVLRAATGAYAALNPGGDEDPNPELCEGLVAWFADDLATADRRFARVNAIDAKNAEAFAYRGLVALRRKDPGGAVKWGGKAVAASRTNALGHYTTALGLFTQNRADEAKPKAFDAARFGAWLFAPRVLSADIDAKQQHSAEAKELLTAVLLSDPNYREAKRVLYKHGL